MTSKAKFLVILLGCIIGLAGCGSKIEGETSTPPPAGGPKGSVSHPPGLTDEEVKKDASR